MPRVFIVVFGVFQILLLLIHAAVYRTLVFAFGWDSPWLAALFGVLSFTFVAASVLSHRFTGIGIKWFYRASAYWFGLVNFLFAGAVIFFMLAVGFFHYDYYVNPALLGGLCFISVIAIDLYATWQTRRPKLTRIEVALAPGQAAWPDYWRGKKIVFVSDFHLGAVWGGKFTERIVRLIEAESPEMVLIGGDIFDGVKCDARAAVAPFANLRPPQGMYFASGNHEYIEDTLVMLDEIRRVGIRVLRNEVVHVAGIQVAGVDWKDAFRRDEFEKILSGDDSGGAGGMRIDHARPSILMRHEPSYLDVAERAGISLTLSGHTHAGQIFPLGFMTRHIYKGFDYGYKRFRKMLVYTSSGVGTWGPPLRFGTKSEIVVITLK